MNLFENDDIAIIMISSPALGLLKHKFKMTGDCSVLKFLRCIVYGVLLCV